MSTFKVIVKEVHEYLLYTDADTEEVAQEQAFNMIADGDFSEHDVWDQSVEVEVHEKV